MFVFYESCNHHTGCHGDLVLNKTCFKQNLLSSYCHLSLRYTCMSMCMAMKFFGA